MTRIDVKKNHSRTFAVFDDKKEEFMEQCETEVVITDIKYPVLADGMIINKPVDVMDVAHIAKDSPIEREIQRTGVTIYEK